MRQTLYESKDRRVADGNVLKVAICLEMRQGKVVILEEDPHTKAGYAFLIARAVL